MNQQLLQSQCQLQEADTAVRALQTYLMQLQMKLATVTSTAFIPYINIPAIHARAQIELILFLVSQHDTVFICFLTF
jgi:hypothetical protein